MILRPSRDSHRVIGKYTGKILVGLGLLMLIPIITAVIFAEWDVAVDFLIAFALCNIVGFGAQVVFRTENDLTWGEGLVVAAGSWVWAVLLAAVPLWLSSHLGSYLDACFDVMSCFTTTGLYLLQDLDHVSYGLNMWRHVLTYVGGQGIVVIALSFLVKGTAGAYKMYVGEGKDERLLPNVVQTARAIWLISIVYLIVGTLAIGSVNVYLGMEPVRAFLHGMWIFMGGWSTGGFAPQSYNTMYYHSILNDVVVMVFFIAGSMNFALHWALWTGKRKEIRRNIEIMSFTITMAIFTTIALWGLAQAHVYPDAVSLARKVFYNIASAHTTTGFGTIYARSFVTQWGPIGLVAMTLAMMIGGSACSTAGGIKGFRVGIIFKSLMADIKKTIMPESSVVSTKYHHVKDSYLNDGLVKGVMSITVLFAATYLFAGVLGTLYGYDFLQSMFEGASALSDSGLSCGITNPAMPDVMKAFYIFFMWFGRFEFMSIFAVGAYFYSVVKGR